jgi:hypothetical protein
MRNLATVLFALALLAFSWPALAGEDDPVVVELFTSQACPACPPAEAYLGELAKRKDIIALEYHIDYYDYSGWKDPFGNTDFTRRWRSYAQSLGARYEYTPFLVIDGAAHMVGSARPEVERRIRAAQGQDTPHPRLTLQRSGNSAMLTVDGSGPPGTYDVLLAGYDDMHKTTVSGGENRGKTLVNVHVVRDLLHVAQWGGKAVTVTLPLARLSGKDGRAVLLQRAGGGPIVAAAAVPD